MPRSVEAIENEDDGYVTIEEECAIYRRALEDIARWGNVKDMAIAKRALHSVSPRGDTDGEEEAKD